MPYKVIEQQGEYCVVKQDTGDPIPGGCHADRLDAEAHMAAILANEADPRFTIRAVSGKECEAYLALWGTPRVTDCYTTYFDRDKWPDFGFTEFRGELAPIRLWYEHGFDPEVGKATLGFIYKIWADGTGLRFRAELNTKSPHYPRIRREIEAGELAVSSASADHMAEWDEDGRFKDWILSEVTLTKYPCEERMPHAVLRSQTPDNPTNAEGDPIGAKVRAADCGCNGSASDNQTNRRSNIMPPAIREGEPTITAGELGISPDMTLAQLIEAIVGKIGADAAEAALKAAMPAAQAEVAEAPATPEMMTEEGRSKAIARALYNQFAQNEPSAKMDALRKQMETLQATIQAQMTAPVQTPPPTRVGGNGHIEVSEPRKYWSRSLSDLMFVYEVNKARGNRASEEFVRVLSGRAAQAIEKKDTLMTSPAVRSVLRAIRADEIVTSTNTGNGDEWIGVAYSDVMWEKMRESEFMEALIAKGMRVEEVQPGHESVVIFTEGADPTMYTITQSADLDATLRPTVVVPVTAPGTGQVTLTPGYLGAAIAYTSVFEEDSLIAAAPQFNKQLQEKSRETVFQLFLNGDTATSGNVNLDGGTPTTQYYMASNGARKYALVTGSGTSRSGTTLDENDYRLTIKLFPSAIRARKEQMMFITDADTHNTALNLAVLKTDDVRVTNATVTSGILEKIWGVDHRETGLLPLADTDGKVTSGGNVTDTGTILGVYAPFWAMGWKRRVTLETSKDIIAQSNLIVATFRAGFVPRGAGAAVATYNITIA